MQPIENRKASNSASMLKTLELRLYEFIIADDPLGSSLNCSRASSWYLADPSKDESNTSYTIELALDKV